MERQPPSLLPYDPELDPAPSRGERRRPPHVILFPHEYQRLVANPFLALALVCAWIGALPAAVKSRNLAIVGIMAAGLFAVVPLLHYHCLDCGKTGWLIRWRLHTCEAVVARQVDGRIRRWRGPTPTVQAVVWLYVLFAMAFVVVVLGLVPTF